MKAEHNIDQLLNLINTPRTAAEVAAITGIDVKKVRTTFTNRMRKGEVSVVGTGHYGNRKGYLYQKNEVPIKVKPIPKKKIGKLIYLEQMQWKKLTSKTHKGYTESIRELVNQLN